MKAFNFTIIASLILFTSVVRTSEAQTHDVYNANGIRVYAKTSTDPFPKAKLKLLTSDNAIKSGKNSFEYAVKSYSLKEQSPSAKHNHLANSGKGQHIHFIVDNKPYQAKYEPNFGAELEPGSHLVLAFLSRSFHESVKEKSAYVLKQYQLNGDEPLANIKKDPLLFYSRPKGTYNMGSGDKIQIDFFLVNTDLEKTGRRVSVTLDGHNFTVNKWQPYLIEGLSQGEHRIRISLIDKHGKSVPGPFNDSGERTFTIQ